MRFILIIVFIFSLTTLNAQDKVIVKYFDTLFKVVSKENAAYYYEFANGDSFYNCTAYYYPSNKLYSKFISVDSNFKSAIGLVTCYFESGKIKDSIFYYPNETEVYGYHYFENGKKQRVDLFGYGHQRTYNTWAFYESGKLKAHVYQKKSSNKLINEVFDEEGKQIPNYIYEQPPKFKNGFKDWNEFISNNFNNAVLIINNAPTGKYNVIVDFDIDTDGRVINIEIENNPGFGSKEEAIRVISKSPKWNPAIKNNKPTIFHMKQGFIFPVPKHFNN